MSMGEQRQINHRPRVMPRNDASMTAMCSNNSTRTVWLWHTFCARSKVAALYSSTVGNANAAVFVACQLGHVRG